MRSSKIRLKKLKLRLRDSALLTTRPPVLPSGSNCFSRSWLFGAVMPRIKFFFFNSSKCCRHRKTCRRTRNTDLNYFRLKADHMQWSWKYFYGVINGCCQMAVQRALWLAKRLSLNLNFSFLNRISLLLISNSYPCPHEAGPRSRPYTSRKISRVKPGIEPGTSWMAVKHANHYTKQMGFHI